MNDYYLKLNSQFLSYESIMSYLKHNEPPWRYNYHIGQARIPSELIKDDFFKNLSRFQIYPLLIKMQPTFFHKWHTDATRNAAVNVQLISGHSHTVFNDDPADKFGHKENIKELIYEPNGIYLFNTQKQHAIMNLGCERLVLSCTFETDDSYETIKRFCLENNL